MKWFKHYSDSYTNLKLKILLREFGLEAYGFFWLCLELVAQQGDKNFRLDQSKYWKQSLQVETGFTIEKLDLILNKFAELNLIDKKSVFKGILWIPKMIEYQDEYRDKVGRKSRQYPDNVRLEENRIDKIRIEENRIDKNIDISTPAQKAKEFFNNPEPVIQELIKKGYPEEPLRFEITKFINYWTELNATGKKQRWEKQPTFEVNRRLATWFGNIKQFNLSQGRQRKTIQL